MAASTHTGPDPSAAQPRDPVAPVVGPADPAAVRRGVTSAPGGADRPRDPAAARRDTVAEQAAAATGDAGAAGGWSLDRVILTEGPPPRRARRPLDVARIIAALVAALVITVIAAAVAETTAVLAIDLRDGFLLLPGWVVQLVSVISGLAGLLVIIVQLGASAVQRRVVRVLEQIAGGVLGVALCAATSAWIDGPAPDPLRLAFEASLPDEVTPIPTYFGFLVGMVSVRGWAGSRWQARASVLAVAGGTVTALIDGTTTLPGAMLAVLLGRCAGIAVRLAAGVPVARPDAAAIATALAAAGLPPTDVREEQAEPPRRYQVVTDQGQLDVLVLDRDREGAGFLSRAWRLLRTRGEVLPRESLTIRADTEQRALVAYAFASAGVRSPALRACLQVDGDCTVLAYDDVPGRRLDEVPVTDALQREIWQQIAAMHRAGLAHRRLTVRAIRVDESGRPWLIDRSGGEVAAGELAQATDVVQMLVVLALRSSPRAAVDNAVAVLGRERVGSAYPLLQQIVLPRATRRGLRGHGELLAELRALVLEHAAPPDRAAVPLERFRPRTIITATSLVVAMYLAGSQLTGVDFLALARSADPAWVVVAFTSFALTLLTDPPALLMFVKQRVSYWRAVGVQLAVSFVKLVMPSALGNAALDFRLLTSSGVPPATATAAAAASQALAVVVTVPLLLVLGVASGRRASAGVTPSVTTVLIAITVVVVLGLLALAPPVRARARALWEGFVANGLASLLDAMQDPRRLGLAVASSLAVTLSFVGCFYACLRALGVTEMSFALLAVIWLTGNAVGTAVPTPGGLGAVEVALTAGLTTAGVPGSLAVSSVLLFRLISFWLPIPVGYVAWVRLQRRGIL
jgi:uncharacterized membrane protein YbhN (UPF0104 family)/tRNA A-37 threonylcarbamoyl transferase component Bud32